MGGRGEPCIPPPSTPPPHHSVIMIARVAIKTASGGPVLGAAIMGATAGWAALASRHGRDRRYRRMGYLLCDTMPPHTLHMPNVCYTCWRMLSTCLIHTCSPKRIGPLARSVSHTFSQSHSPLISRFARPSITPMPTCELPPKNKADVVLL